MSPRDLRATAPRVPAGWLTTRQWAKKWNLSESHAFHVLADGVRLKKVIRRSYRIEVNRRVIPVPHYRAA